ncbi:aldo-keto reductase, partial [Pterulicium gracile]
MSDLTFASKAKLSDGNEIPLLGFGTYEMTNEEAYRCVTWALEAGYRHIDTAEWYENEAACGRAVRDFCASNNVPRSEIFYTTKLMLNNGYDKVRESIRRSVKLSGLEYVDLYLVHGPIGGAEMRKQSWRAVCDAKKEEGTLRSIGITTFGVRHLEEILSIEGVEVPVVHQIDLHPFMSRAEIVEFSKARGMLMEAWAPLVRALRFEHPAIRGLADKYKKSPAQVLLRYSLQKGYVPLPKSASKDRIISNKDVFDFSLSEDEMKQLSSLNENLVTDWDPTDD